ncbi:MAG: hypothetical protein R2782_09470, partial [Flavobacterium sp.]
MKKLIVHLFLVLTTCVFAQVGINTTSPNAQLDIQSTNQANPSNTDGILIPKVDTFPGVNPGANQNGMLVFLTTTVGTNTPGFYYWNNPTTTWVPIKGTDTGTLDQAYDFGGAGNGRTITADAGAVLIDGTDGLVSTGSLGSGVTVPSGSGSRMVWNPRKVAFRAGRVSGTQWDDVNVGFFSTAFGFNTTASGIQSTAFGINTIASSSNSVAFGSDNTASNINTAAFGNNTTASGGTSTAFGFNTIASGSISTSFGLNTIASGDNSISFGDNTVASGSRSTAFGAYNASPSYGETVIGIGATTYIPSPNGDTQFRPSNATDRLFVIGNATDINNNNIVESGERSDALIIQKSGLTRLPSTTNTMIDAADGKAVVTKEYLQSSTSGTLDQAYDFGGAGAGRTITADAGAVLINGTDGLVSTGTLNSGAVAPSGAGVRLVWNPNKAALRAGNVLGTFWDDANIGSSSVALGNNTRASAFASVAIGNFVTATGLGSSAFGTSSTANGQASTVFGRQNVANGNESTAFGYHNFSNSYGETVLGIGATTYSLTANGATQFRAANATDRLFVIGNAIDANFNSFIEASERSDAMVVLKNGATGIGSSTPNALLDIASNDKGIMVPRVALTSANVASPIINPSGGTLPESTLVYNTTTAGVGENEVTPGFHYWNGTKWVKLEENNGKTKYYTALGTTNAGSTSIKTLMPEMEITFTPKSSVVMVNFSASGFNAQGQTPVFFDVLLNGTIVKSFQTSVEDIVGGINRPIWDINFLYPISVTPFVTQTISINWATINTVSSNFVQTPASFGGSFSVNAHRVLTVIDPEGGGGIVTPVVPPITNDYWNIHGNTGTNPTINFIGTSDAQPLVFRTNNIERMRIFNGNLGIGTAFPSAPLEVMGNIRMVDGNQQTGRVLTSSATGLASWQDLNTWSILGNAGTDPTTNFIGTSDNQSFVFRTNNLERMRLDANGNFGIGTTTPNKRFHIADNSTSTTIGQLYLEQSGTGDAIMHIGNTGARHYNLGLDTSTDNFKIATHATTPNSLTSTTLVTVQPTGEVGVGTTVPNQKLHVSGPAGLTAIKITNTSLTGATSNVALDFQRGGNSNTDWRIYNIGPNLTIANSGDELTTINDLYQFQISRFMPMNDATQNLGVGTNRWNTLFATN